MSQTDEQRSDARTKRMLLEIREEVITLRSRYLEERTGGTVHPRTERAFRGATIMYYEALREHRNEAVINDEWEDSGVQELEYLLTETTTVEQSTPGHGSATTVREVPLFQQADMMRLVRITQKMDDLCKKLGFSPAVNESTPRTNINEELVEDVEEWRQRNLE